MTQGRTGSVCRPARQSLEIVDPGHGGAAPDLAPRLQLVALADTAPADAPIVGTAVLAAGEQRGTAFVAEMLKPDAAIVAGLAVDFRRLAGQPDLFAGADHGHPVGRAGKRLAIPAVTDRHPFRIDLGLI